MVKKPDDDEALPAPKSPGTPDKPVKHLQICPKCAGYMQPVSPIPGKAGTRNWKDETYLRSFGGVEVKKFVCEKCHHVETFQIDDLGHLGEDD